MSDGKGNFHEFDNMLHVIGKENTLEIASFLESTILGSQSKFMVCSIHQLKATADEQFLSQETRDFCLKRQKSPVCGRQRREIFVARDENEKSNMFDIYNNRQEIFISCDKNRLCAVFGDLFLKQGISYR